ncbi:MAG: HAD family hydrolase [Bacteroidota bacterium]
MAFQAVFFDLGGVIVRTEYQAPRQHLAERLGTEYEDLVRAVFGSETARQASLGKISEAQHWDFVARRFGRPPSEAQALRGEFYGGDIVDHELIEFIRSLRPRFKTGVISNAFSGLRQYMIDNKFEDAFDRIIISAEVGAMKPEPGIFQIALESSGVPAEAAVFVDDFPENLEGARTVGMATVHFRDPAKAVAEIEALLNHHPHLP